MRWLSYRIFRALGWTIDGELPDLPKFVIIGAPHTSNWDFFLFLAAMYAFDVKMSFLGKASLFRWPFGFMFEKVGGIPVDRSKAGGIVRQVKAAFDRSEKMILVIAPEGTRRAAPAWKSGFVEIAARAEVPVVFAGVDGANKTLVISPPHYVGDDKAAYMDEVRSFLEDIHGLRPEHKGPVRLGTEKSVS